MSQARAGDIELILKPGQSLIEYKFFDPYDFDTTEFGARRLLAVILRSDADPAIVDLGEADIFPSLQALTVNAELRASQEVPFETVMSVAYARLIAPLTPYLRFIGGVTSRLG